MNDKIKEKKGNLNLKDDFYKLKDLLAEFGMTIEGNPKTKYTLINLNEVVGENLSGTKAIWESAKASLGTKNFERQAQTSVSKEAELD